MQFIKEYLEDLEKQGEVLATSKKLRGKYPPISFLVSGISKTLKIKTVISLAGDYKNLYVFRLKNYTNNPKIRNFLAISLASQSSDLLATLAKELISENKGLRLIQYCVFPNTLRINLLLLIELDENQTFSNAVKVLKGIRLQFRKKLGKITTLME